jgi:hypothetical protein
MDFGNDPHLDVCQAIETGLKHEYERHPGLTDMQCIFALQNAKIAAKHHFGYGKNESVVASPETEGIIGWCVEVAAERVGKVNNLTLREFNARLDKIARSVRRHSQDGSRAYYAFIKDFVV